MTSLHVDAVVQMSGSAYVLSRHFVIFLSNSLMAEAQSIGAILGGLCLPCHRCDKQPIAQTFPSELVSEAADVLDDTPGHLSGSFLSFTYKKKKTNLEFTLPFFFFVSHSQ